MPELTHERITISKSKQYQEFAEQAERRIAEQRDKSQENDWLGVVH